MNFQVPGSFADQEQQFSMEAFLEIKARMMGSLLPDPLEDHHQEPITVKQQIEAIEKNVEELWPQFKESEELDFLLEIITYPFNEDKVSEHFLYGEEYQDYFSEEHADDHLDKKLLALTDYTKCLGYLGRYVQSTGDSDPSTYLRFFEEEARRISAVTSKILAKLLANPESRHIKPFVACFLNYARVLLEVERIHDSLIDLDDSLIDLENFSDDSPNMMTIFTTLFDNGFGTTCLISFLLSDTPTTRADSVQLRRLLRSQDFLGYITIDRQVEMTEMSALESACENFYKETRRSWLLSIFQAASVEFVDAEWQYEIVEDFLDHISPSARVTLFNDMLNLSVTILGKRFNTGPWGNCLQTGEHDARDRIQQPNRILKCIERKFPSNLLNCLKTIITDHQAAETMCSQAIVFSFNFKPLNYMINVAKGELSTADVPYELFLIPILLSTLGSVKTWTLAHKNLASLLADKLQTQWKETLNVLRDQLVGDNVTERTKLVFPWVINQWWRLGTLLGLHLLAGGEPLVGCFYGKCPSFLREATTRLEMPKCPCKRAQYCDADCQKRDWKTHKPHCSFTKEK